MNVEIKDPNTKIEFLEPLDTFYCATDIYLMSVYNGDSYMAVRLTDGELLGFRKGTKVVKVPSTLKILADLHTLSGV